MIYEPGMTLKPSIEPSSDGHRIYLSFVTPTQDLIFFYRFDLGEVALFYGHTPIEAYQTFLKFVMGLPVNRCDDVA